MRPRLQEGHVVGVGQSRRWERGASLSKLFYGSFLQYWWEDELGNVHEVSGSRRSPLPFLGRHGPEGVGVAHMSLEKSLWEHARIQVHVGKTKNLESTRREQKHVTFSKEERGPVFGEEGSKI